MDGGKRETQSQRNIIFILVGGGGPSSRPCWTPTGNSNTWYTLDALPCFYDNLMLRNIKPNGAVGSNLALMYQHWPFPYRYFDRDASGTNSVFQPGQLLQTLPGITITGNGSGSGMYVSFLGSPSPRPTKIYTNGDPSKGVEITNGSIRLSNGGSMKLQ